jgi:hypothetical protein
MMYDHPELLRVVREVFARRGLGFFGTGPYDLTAFGVRAATEQAGFFDVFGFAYPDERGREHLWLLKGSTKPTPHWLREPMRREGCAVLVPGQYPAFWKPGLHRGEYRALVQVGAGLVWRDPDQGLTVNPPRDKTWPATGINFHYGDGTWASAGCQVTPLREDLNRVLALVDRQAASGFGDTLTYALLEAAADPALDTLRTGSEG